MSKLTFAIALTSLVVLTPALGQASVSSLPTENEVRLLQLEAMRVLGAVLLDPARSEADRLNTATVLVRNGDRTTLPLLTTTLLGDPFASVRRVVAEGLGRFRAPEATFALRQAALSGPIDSVRWAAAVSLVQIDSEQGDIIDVLLTQRDTLSAAALSLQNDATVKAFPQAFHDRVQTAFIQAFPDALTYNKVERAAMAKSLAALGSQRAVPLLSAALSDVDEDPFVRGAAAFSLGILGVQNVVPDLIAAIDSGEDPLQVGALNALGRLANAQAISPIVALLASEDSAEIRASAVSALGSFGQTAVSVLIDVLNTDSSPTVRQAALQVLVPLGEVSEGITQAVVDFVTGPYLPACDPQACSTLALETISALAKLDQGDLALQLLNASIDALADVLPFVFAFAEEDLIRVAVEVGQVAPQVLDVLLANDNAFVKAIALAALPQIDPAGARQVLLPFVVPEENRLLRRMAFEGLAQMPRPEDLGLYLAELQNKDRRTRAAAYSAIVKVGDAQVVAPLLEALASEKLSVQLQAVEASFEFGKRILAIKALSA